MSAQGAEAADGDGAPVEPERQAAYWERKGEELALLRAAAAEPEPASRPRDGAALVGEKQRLRARILARAILDDPALTESNLGPARRPYRDGGVAFGYQRWDARWVTRRFAEWVYPPAAGAAPWPQAVSLGLLTSSGMSAVTATLSALDGLLPAGTPLLLPLRAYFETLTFCGRYLHRLAPRLHGDDAPFDRSVLFLDSITPDDEPAELARPLGPLAAVLFDTTCYDVASPRIARVVERATAEGVPLLLLRSHLKLDCLGTEYGRLGSIVLLLPRRAARPAIAFARALRRAVIEALALHGSGFSPHHVFPPAHEPALRDRFWALNRIRNRRIVAANARAGAAVAARALAESTTRLRLHHHHCFFIVDPFLDDAPTVQGFAEELRARLVRAGLHALRAPSFGYDFIAVTQLSGGNEYFQSSALRIALPDAPAEEVDRFIEVAGDWAVSLDRGG